MTVLFHLPDPIGWIALTPDALRDAQALARVAIGVEKTSDERARHAEAPDYVSAEVAAQALAIDASWLLRRARMGKVPFLKVGKYRRFCIDELRIHFAKEPK